MTAAEAPRTPPVVFVPATVQHALELGPRLRAEDVAEVQALGFPDGRSALLRSLASSDVAWTALYEGEPAAMFGVGPLNRAALVPDIGQMWFLTGELFGQHPRAFLRQSRSMVDAMLEMYPALFNLIDARYTAAIAIAKLHGASVGEPVPHGPKGLPFVPYLIRRQ